MNDPERLNKGLAGKSRSQGGLNLNELIDIAKQMGLPTRGRREDITKAIKDILEHKRVPSPHHEAPTIRRPIIPVEDQILALAREIDRERDKAKEEYEHKLRQLDQRFNIEKAEIIKNSTEVNDIDSIIKNYIREHLYDKVISDFDLLTIKEVLQTLEARELNLEYAELLVSYINSGQRNYDFIFEMTDNHDELLFYYGLWEMISAGSLDVVLQLIERYGLAHYHPDRHFDELVFDNLNENTFNNIVNGLVMLVEHGFDYNYLQHLTETLNELEFDTTDLHYQFALEVLKRLYQHSLSDDDIDKLNISKELKQEIKESKHLIKFAGKR